MPRHHAHHVITKKQKQPFDYVVYFFMIATPLFEIPQAVTIYTLKSAYGVSFITWLFFFMASIVWMSYGIRNKQWPIFITYCLYFVMEAIIIAGILIYS